MKKTFAALLLTGLCGFAQGTLTLSNTATPPPAGYTPGATIPLNITKTGNSPTGIQFDLSIPASTGAITIALGPGVPAGKSITCSTGASTRCLIVGLDTNVIPDGIVAVASVTLANPLTVNPVAVMLANPVEADAGANSLPVTIANPTLSLSIKNGCDVNGDGSVTSADLSAVAAQAITKTNATATDLNRDGKTDVLDAQIVGTAATGPALPVSRING
jgi:hypothetical protein